MLSRAAVRFEAELREQLERNPGLRAELEQMAPDAVEDLARRAAASALAPLVWRVAVGDSWDVRRVAQFLGVSRQALYKRTRVGTALGISGEGTTWFPVWQLDGERRIVRAVVGALIQVFRDADPEIESQMIAGWAARPVGGLGGHAPAAWIRAGGDAREVLEHARRAAAALSA